MNPFGRHVSALPGRSLRIAAKLPNLPWVVDAQTLKETIAFEKVQLINDLEANGYGIPLLAADELEPFTAVRSILRGIAESLM